MAFRVGQIECDSPSEAIELEAVVTGKNREETHKANGASTSKPIAGKTKGKPGRKPKADVAGFIAALEEPCVLMLRTLIDAGQPVDTAELSSLMGCEPKKFGPIGRKIFGCAMKHGFITTPLVSVGIKVAGRPRTRYSIDATYSEAIRAVLAQPVPDEIPREEPVAEAV